MDETNKPIEPKIALNIENNNGNIYTLGNHASEKEPDLSDIFTPIGDWYPDDNEVNEYAQLLFQNRILITYCSDKDALDCLTNSISQSDRFSEFNNKRLLWIFEGFENKIQSLDELRRKDIKSQTFYIIDVNSQTFLDSLFNYDKKTVEKYQDWLISNDYYFFCKIDSDILIEYIESKKEKLHFILKPISRLRFILRKKGRFNAKKTLFYEEHLLKQKYEGLWGKISDREFLDTISRFLEEDIFEEKFTERASIKDKTEKGVQLFLKSEIPKLKPSDFIIQSEPIIMHLAFIGAYFPALTVKEFHDLTNILLSDERKIIKEFTSKIITKEDGSSEEIKETIIKKCIQEWTNDKDNFLEKSKLKLIKSDSKTEGIDFLEPYLREDVQEFIEQKFPFYFQEQIDFLISKGILFDNDISENIINHLLKLSARIASKDPQAYGLEYLTGLLTYLKQVDIIEDETIEGFIERIKFEHQRELALFRLYRIVAEFLNYSNLDKTVEGFINFLFNNKHFDIVFSIIKYLKNASNFKKFYWIKQIFERGNEECKKKTYELLLDFVIKSVEERAFEHLDEIKKWLPKLDQLPQNHSSNSYALAFIIDYSFKKIEEVPSEAFGKYPSKYSLFAGLSDERRIDTEGGWNDLLSWLFHPFLYTGCENSIVITQISKTESFVNIEESNQDSIVTDILSHWYFVLHGWEDEPNLNNNKSIDNMLKTVQKIVGNKRLKNISFYLNRLTDMYFYLLTKTSLKEKENRNTLRKRRELTKKMNNQIREILKSNTL